MIKLIALLTLVISSNLAAAEGNLTLDQSCAFGYVNAQCEAVTDARTLTAVDEYSKKPTVKISRSEYKTVLPYINGGYFEVLPE